MPAHDMDLDQPEFFWKWRASRASPAQRKSVSARSPPSRPTVWALEEEVGAVPPTAPEAASAHRVGQIVFQTAKNA